MKIVVIGGTGLIGSKLVQILDERGHDAVAAAPSTGVNTFTGEGLGEVLDGAEVVVDVSNSPNLDDSAKEFFRTATTNLLTAEKDAGVGHHVALSVVGTDALAPQSGYFQAKLDQERLISDGPIPYTIVHATQFFEFLQTLADSATEGDTVRMPPAYFQPMAAADVAEGLAIAAANDPVNRIVEIGGPVEALLPDLLRSALAARGDNRHVVADPEATYWGIALGERTLVPGADATLFDTRFEDWILETAAKA
ncbi:NmrA family transcriptional regulator [Mycolicibacterium sp. GF69]|uniref:SDR family oxidoreductase n=1 Tax=Mycolicibacterium sp. GF69 TaxID=2267251 RepID=UPI000DCBA359|nr:SDR family oxidoreductase [Mycolicibacterium sp. GF69]RAV18314.1 NmrA family transcriptional regulator [Mycolicibacterium sp. GF69]